MTRAELIARIKKCLALSKSGNEHEAAAALAKARELMDEYGVDQVDVMIADVSEERTSGSKVARAPFWENILVLAITRALPVRAVADHQGWRFFGLTPAPEIAGYAFATLFRQLKRARTAYIGTKLKRCTLARKRIRADHFCEGWAEAVFAKIEALASRPELDPSITTYLTRNYPSLAPYHARGSAKGGGQAVANDWWAGRQEGRSVELNRGVGTDSRPALSAANG